MKIIPFGNDIYSRILKSLKNGGLVIAPSDTVYGLLVDATNQKAVEKLIRFKNRPQGKPISVFVNNFRMLEKQVRITLQQKETLKKLLPGPFTVILQSKSSQTRSKHQVSKLLESEKETLGIRIPDYIFITELVREFNKPITATSANLSGRLPHYSIDSLLNELPESKKSLIDYIVDAGKLPHNKPSTVIDLSTPSIKVIRHGDIIIGQKQSYLSQSLHQTKKIGQYLLQKYGKNLTKKPLVFIIEGPLGVGKTILVKGIAEFLGVDNIVSPTFVIYYEYPIKVFKIKKLYHFDLYKIQDSEEFKYLHIEKLLKPKSLLCFEWGEKTGEIIDLLKNKAKIIYIEMKYVSEKERKIII